MPYRQNGLDSPRASLYAEPVSETPVDDRLITSKEVAEMLGLHPDTITSYRARKQMPLPDEQYGRTPLWRVSTIREWRYKA